MKKRGMRVDVVRIEEGTERHDVEVRFDKKTGDFLAELNGEHFTARSIDHMKTALKERVKQLVQYVYKWYLVIEFNVNSIGFYGIENRPSADAIRRQDKVKAFAFDFRVEERSESKQFSSNQVAFMARPVVDNETTGELQPCGMPMLRIVNFARDKETVIEYTPERYAKLLAIRRAMKELALQLHAIVGEKPEAVAALLDGLHGAPLALATESTVKAKS